MFPRRAIGSVVGIGGMAGAIGGMLIASTVGLILSVHRLLSSDLRDCRQCLPGGAWNYSFTGAPASNRPTSRRQLRRDKNDERAQNKTEKSCRWDLVSLGEVMLAARSG